MDSELPKKRRKLDKRSKESKFAKVEAEPCPPPLPPTPDATSAPPLPETDCIPLILSPHMDECADEMDMKNLLAEHDIPSADGDVVLPTVPSLSDLMCQSDICGSIASTDSSPTPEMNEAAQPAGQCIGDTLASSYVKDVQPKNELTEESPLPPAKYNDCATNQNPAINLEDSLTNDTAIGSQAELDAHAHALLDSTSDVKTEPQDNQDGFNEEGYKLRTRQHVKDIVPKSQYEVLPEGWKELTHVTGLSVYCHLPTRVVTWSRPYFLDDRFAKTHDVPVSAIPCMLYRKCKELMKNKECSKNVAGQSAEQSVEQSTGIGAADQQSDNTQLNGVQKTSQKGNIAIDGVVIKTEPEEGKAEPPGDTDPFVTKLHPLTSDVLTEYCKNVFDFEQKSVKQFTSWKLRKEHDRKMKVTNKEMNASKEGAPRVVIPVTELPEAYQRDERGKLKRDFIVIFGTQTIIDIFHQYINWMYRQAPIVVIKPLDQGFQCNICYKGDNSIVGTGTGNTKKSAKESAAICALQVLVPKYADQLIKNALSYGDKEKSQAGLDEYYKIFDSMSIKDERVVEVAKDTNQVYPFVVLKSCLARNFAMSDNDIQVKTYMERKAHRVGIVCDMTVGNYSVTGAKGKNTKLAMHAAAQDILQQLHPKVQTWGAILRLYGKFADGSSDDNRHKLANQSEVTSLQMSKSVEEGDKVVTVKPLDEVSDPVLRKLRKQMIRQYKCREEGGESVNKKKFDHGDVAMNEASKQSVTNAS